MPNLRALYSGCVPCIENNYLRQPSAVLKLSENSSKYFEGYVTFYCKHSNCCGCEVIGKAKFYTYHNKVEAVMEVSGKRSYFRSCTKARPVKGKRREELAEKMEHEKPYSVFRKLQLSLNEEERVYGSSTYAPSHAVLRNIKSKGNISNRYSNNWIINVKAMEEIFSKKQGSFVRDIKVSKCPEIFLFTDAQIKVYGEICHRDIIYFDATGSIMKKSTSEKDFQIYTLLVRHPNEGGPALPVATSITTRHDAHSICNFLNFFLSAATKLIGLKAKPIAVMIDGSMAMWNAVLRAFSNETRLDYYHRCWRIVNGKAESLDLKKTFV